MAGSTVATDSHTQTSSPKRWILPLLAPIIGLLVAALIVTPMLGAKAENLPVAIVNADSGITLPTGETINAGAQAVENLTSADQQVLDFTLVTSGQSAEELLEDEGYYAVLEIPADFSQAAAAAQAGGGEASALTATVDQSKTMMGVQTATNALTAMSQNSPVAINVTTINKIPTEWGFAGSFAPMMLFMGTFISSMVSSVLLAGSHSVSRARGATAWVNAGLQVVYGSAAALLVGFGMAWLVQSITGFELPFSELAIFLSALSAGYIALTTSFLDLLGAKGVALSALTMLLGTATLSIPRQFLPTFWNEWIYPWTPARFAGQGVRDILYAGEAWLNSNTGAFFWMVAIGLTLIAVAAFKNRTPKELVA
ncbi:YhgE/Pip domain-containing protein [Rothia nasimurium]|uniref:YhgE/Pip domain-containing protein n=1 Tax=Rothia nasimurium TaxID=85336 RepID=UPI00360B7F43